MDFICVTRENETAQDKPKVYFTGHPEDLSVYGADIFPDILKTQNCAIFYDSEIGQPCSREELFQELERMQLIVIPVTSRFLYQPNRARETELPFALERHIPVLPLMQERGLEHDFNQKCGTLQMLSRYSDPDPTVLSYDKKLERFLSSVLAGDELAEKVRAAFDAYVFLSYRKKDRQYAQKLMRLIHKNPFCRDIAIWYDEFLVPGENFNAAISDAIRKCQLFAMTVTPNILEEGNYIITNEYEEVRKLGKPVLPVELVPTDRESLQSAFQDIPPCTDAEDGPALSAALLASLQKLAVRENGGSPEHDFFIGLAYLNGIDVEVDRERAFSLITGAAEAGLPEAMEKLVSMYRSGDSTARDCRAATRWQERLAGYWRTRYEESGALKDGLLWGSYLGGLGDSQKELADLTAARQAYQQMLDVYRRLSGQCGDPRLRHNLFIGCTCLGDISQAEDRTAEAKAHYLEGLELSRQLCEETGTAEARWDLFISYSRLGDISRAEGRLAEAKAYYLQSLELNGQLCEEVGTEGLWRNLSISWSKLGDISQTEGKLAEAKAYYLQDMKLNIQLYKEFGTAEARRGLFISGNKLSKLYLAEGCLAEAKEYSLHTLKLSRQMYRETGTAEARRDISVSYEVLGIISQTEDRLEEARAYYLQSLELRKQLCEETGTVKARRDLSVSYSRMGEISQAGGDLAGARAYYLQDLELSRQLCEETGTAEARRDLSVSYEKLGDISLDEGSIAEAKAYFLQSLELRRQLCGETMTVNARRDLSLCYDRLGEISLKDGSPAEAKAYFLQSLELHRQLYKETGTVQSLDDMALICCCVGDVSDPGERKEMYSQAYHIWKHLCERCPDIPLFAQRRDTARDILGSLA